MIEKQVDSLKEFVLGKMKDSKSYDESKTLIQIYEKVKRIELALIEREKIINVLVLNPN